MHARSGLTRRRLYVDGRLASCAVGGAGPPVVFLHGWGLGHQSYHGALQEVMARGCRVYAPALPGFGGTADLPPGQRTIAGYAAWVEAFLTAVGVDEPAIVVGHSFGGGVAIGLAHDAPAKVRQLVLINSIGSSPEAGGPTLGTRPYDRPPWEYGLHLMREMFWSRDSYRLLQAMSDDLIRNISFNPWALIEIGLLARYADLTTELAQLRERAVPILVLWSDGDGVLPLASFDALCAAIGTEGRVLHGGHSWLLANPRAFSAVLENVVDVQVAERELTGVRTTASELTALLRRTRIPARVVARLVKAASPLWMLSEQPSVLAADLALCHPPLADGEVRAVAREMDEPATFRLTVVAADRPGLLADTAAALADEGITVLSASVATWTDADIALHSLTVTSTTGVDPHWDALGERLRSRPPSSMADARYTRTGKATVSAAAASPGRSLVTVTAPDGVGLLEAITRWFADRSVSIDAAEVVTHNGRATDRFLVDGDFEASELAAHLTKTPSRRRRRLPCCRPWR